MNNQKLPPLSEFSSISERSKWIADKWASERRRTPTFTALQQALRGCAECYRACRDNGHSRAVSAWRAASILQILFIVHR